MNTQINIKKQYKNWNKIEEYETIILQNFKVKFLKSCSYLKIDIQQFKQQSQISNCTHMTQDNFLNINIPFSQQNHCSVYFAHLQNTLLKIKQSLKSQSAQSGSTQIDKVSRIIYDIYLQHQKLQNTYNQLSKSTKQMMTQFTQMLTQCKDDRQKLMQTTKDRHDLLQRLKESNEDSFQLVSQNQILKETVAKLKQINQLFVEKNNVLESQLENRKLSQLGVDSYKRVMQQYDRLLASNTEIRKQLSQIEGHTQIIQQISKPMQVINQALITNPKLRDQIWESANKKSQNNVNESDLKKVFYQFNFDQYLNKIKQQYSQ